MRSRSFTYVFPKLRLSIPLNTLMAALENSIHALWALYPPFCIALFKCSSKVLKVQSWNYLSNPPSNRDNFDKGRTPILGLELDQWPYLQVSVRLQGPVKYQRSWISHWLINLKIIRWLHCHDKSSTRFDTWCWACWTSAKVSLPSCCSLTEGGRRLSWVERGRQCTAWRTHMISSCNALALRTVCLSKAWLRPQLEHKFSNSKLV